MVAANGDNGRAIDLDFLQGLASELTDEQKFGQSIGGDFLSPSHSCQLCHQTFSTGKMLQAHNQAAHADKTFVCEICGKAFRFRSNLAEHRSVHTAVKPFVCKFCGKSSRLKGNLTKHILKHHKMEQIDCIGKDDIIIKKGKKSVKDPAAIDFLEKSMIVLQNAAQAARYAADGRPRGSAAGAWDSERSSDGGATPSDELSGQDSARAGGFLMPFVGLDESAGAGGADDSPDGSCVGTSRASSMNLGEYNNPPNLHAHTANDQLLERCKMEIDEDEAPDEEEDDENEEDQRGVEVGAEAENRPASNFASVIDGLTAGAGAIRPLNSTVAMAAAACKAILFGNMAAAANAKRSNSGSASFDGNVNDDGDDVHVIGSIKRFGSLMNASTPTSCAGGPIRSSSQCPECGKHLRKPRDLVTHLATIHNISPNSALANGCSSSSSSAENNDSGAVSAVQELRNLQKMMSDLKNTSQNVSPTDHGGMLKVNQMVMSLDGRVGRLEKQVEMALNSIYTLVQLQTGINNQMTRFRDETGDQLRNVINILSEGKAARGVTST